MEIIWSVFTLAFPTIPVELIVRSVFALSVATIPVELIIRSVFALSVTTIPVEPMLRWRWKIPTEALVWVLLVVCIPVLAMLRCAMLMIWPKFAAAR